ncbi:nitric oxide synthase oxygenase [Catellatospora sp. KI3]|uniref:nitric oxide synthase oxygenase n=1 Tax=Catellatospora sp. KI3 TaxID=3041620 RepID=UPI002482906B|nr:nitric oxide synthase oxygenase [Catellatospora sp. KI3]MDI1461984.1 nitric oxide synthase oxygenase [Catellatospora sp. KI3]
MSAPHTPPVGYRDAPPTEWDPDRPVDFAEAEDFLRACYAELPKLGPVEPRLAAAREQIDALGTYTHTHTELVHGARMAWRNASRCIGRVYWRSLSVLDRRTHRGEDQIFADLVSHLHLATGDGHTRGRLRATISIFGQSVPGRPITRVWNDQLIRYAGHRKDGSLVGDPQYEQFTAEVAKLGWTGKGSAFDLLPIVLQTGDGQPRLFELPESAVLEVPLAHPEYSWFAELGLRWHAVPAISNMRLSIGGVDYPLAPFSGWYMGTEIGARNLADADRYDQIPVIAARLGLDTSSETTLWRDRALLELNRAVLWSFERSGVRMTDHHSESKLFLTHVERERKAGRETPGDWSWLVPPLSGGLSPIFHQYYPEADQRPNFYLDRAARCPWQPQPVPQVPAQRTESAAAPRPTTCPVTGQSAAAPIGQSAAALTGQPAAAPTGQPAAALTGPSAGTGAAAPPTAPVTVRAAAPAPAEPAPPPVGRARVPLAAAGSTAAGSTAAELTAAAAAVRPDGSAASPVVAVADAEPVRRRGLRRLLG